MTIKDGGIESRSHEATTAVAEEKKDEAAKTGSKVSIEDDEFRMTSSNPVDDDCGVEHIGMTGHNDTRLSDGGDSGPGQESVRKKRKTQDGTPVADRKDDSKMSVENIVGSDNDYDISMDMEDEKVVARSTAASSPFLDSQIDDNSLEEALRKLDMWSKELVELKEKLEEARVGIILFQTGISGTVKILPFRYAIVIPS